MSTPKEPAWLTPHYWQARFDSGDTPWELGHPSVVLLEAFDIVSQLGCPVSGTKVLSPGCGKGSDALAIAGRGAHVVAVDWSPIAVNSLELKRSEMSSSTGSLEILAGDFFQIPCRTVDCVAEHTFFCAIDPSARPRYAERIAQWIRPGGFLVGNFFVLPDAEAAALPRLSLTPAGEGPPFATTVAELHRLFSSYFTMRVLRPALHQERDRRPGMEWVGIFQRVA
jgi:SAM-dependent methyltransferase